MEVAPIESGTMTRSASHHRIFIMKTFNSCQIKTQKPNFRIKWFVGTTSFFWITFKVSMNNRKLSALNETSGEWRILDPEVKDSHILPLGTLFKVNTYLKNRDHIWLQSCSSAPDPEGGSLKNQWITTTRLKSFLGRIWTRSRYGFQNWFLCRRKDC